MREIKTLQDAAIVLRDFWDWRNKLDTKNIDLHGRKVVNATPGSDPMDYATVSQLPPVTQTSTGPDLSYSIPFSHDGVIVAGSLASAFTVGRGREGTPYEVHLVAQTPPSGGPAKLNFQVNGTNLLATDIELPAGSQDVVVASNFIAPTPFLGYLTQIAPIVTLANNAAFVTLTLVVKRNRT